MKLTVKERLKLPMILPQQGKMIEMKLCKAILDTIEFSPADITCYKLKDNKDGSVSWDTTKAKEKEIEFSTEQIELLKTAIKNLDEAGQISIDMLPLCEKINEAN